MTRNERQSADTDKGSLEKKKPDNRGAEEVTEGCRCEEVSKKTLPEMLKLMLSDLAFWKKKKEHK